MMTVEQIASVHRIGRDEVGMRTSIGLTELDELCETARSGVRLADMLRGFIEHADRHGESHEPDIKALRQFLKIAGFEP